MNESTPAYLGKEEEYFIRRTGLATSRSSEKLIETALTSAPIVIWSRDSRVLRGQKYLPYLFLATTRRTLLLPCGTGWFPTCIQYLRNTSVLFLFHADKIESRRAHFVSKRRTGGTSLASLSVGSYTLYETCFLDYNKTSRGKAVLLDCTIPLLVGEVEY